MNLLLPVALSLCVGLMMTRIFKKLGLKLPDVTAFLIAGVAVGPFVLGAFGIEGLGFTSLEQVEATSVISNVALGFIAFDIGNESRLESLKKTGRQALIIGIFQALAATAVVDLVLVLISVTTHILSISAAITLGAIASATAPAATLMVVRQYKAKGPVTETLLSVVAIDDATALMLFSVFVAIAQALVNPSSGPAASSLLSPLIEIGGAIVVGGLLGFLFVIPLRWFKKDGNRLSLIAAFLFFGIGISELCGFSSLLLCMSMGAVIANLSQDLDHIMRLCDGVTPPIFMLFFVASGADLKISVLPTVGVVGVIYIVLRVCGKIFGAWLGGTVCKADAKVRKYLGPSLCPQAGVAIGLSLVATRVDPEYGASIRAIILCGTLIYELIGPAVTKLSLKAAGEIAKDQ